MKICAPICSATVVPLVAMEPEAGAAMPFLRLSQAVCSVELPLPPHHRIDALLDDVVEPGLADILGREVGRDAVVLERADEGEGAGHVVVGDDQRLAEPLVDVVLDRARAPP